MPFQTTLSSSVRETVLIWENQSQKCRQSWGANPWRPALQRASATMNRLPLLPRLNTRQVRQLAQVQECSSCLQIVCPVKNFLTPSIPLILIFPNGYWAMAVYGWLCSITIEKHRKFCKTGSRELMINRTHQVIDSRSVFDGKDWRCKATGQRAVWCV